MPKKKSDVNKGQLVREFFAAHPTAKVSEVVSGLAERGVKVSSTYVYGVKSMGKAKKQKAKRQKAMASSNGVADPVALIQGIKQLAAQAGGMSNLKKLVEILE